MPDLNDLRRQWATEPDVKIRAQLAKRMAELDPNFNLPPHPPSPFRATDVLKVSGVSDSTPLRKADIRKPDYGIAKFLWQEGPRWHEGKKVTVFSLAHRTDKASGEVVWTGLQNGISLTSQQPESADGEKRVTGVVMQAYSKARHPAVLVDWDGDTQKETVLESKGVEGYDPNEDGHKFISARSPFRKAATRQPNH